MRNVVPGMLLLCLAAAAWADERDEREREIVAAKERLQAMRAEVARLEKEGRADEAARVRAEAGRLEEEIHHALGHRAEGEDPHQQALRDLEKAIAAVDRAGHEELAHELRDAADRLRARIAECEARARSEGPYAEEIAFWRRNTDTLRLAMQALAEGERQDGVALIERAIHARQVMVSGHVDEGARHILHSGPDDARLAELLHAAAGLWREFEQPEKAERVQTLGNVLAARAAKTAEGAKDLHPEGGRELGPPPEKGLMDRIERVEARMERLEAAVQELLARLKHEEVAR